MFAVIHLCSLMDPLQSFQCFSLRWVQTQLKCFKKSMNTEVFGSSQDFTGSFTQQFNAW